ncbi:hypothetical protein RCC89_12680 [Cytophagaceae bacterium ABcell3]|nr:hypothetical protein RCC89_12680 [Cytophagaceae bacterium ABcell3]
MKLNKYYPKTLEKAVLQSLSHYPQLKQTEIHFKLVSPIGSSVMQAQPLPRTIFEPNHKRAYIIKISETFNMDGQTFSIHEMPYNVLLGWLGHELGHVMDYLNRSLSSLAVFGLGYVFSGTYMKKVEMEADRYAIAHGLGEYIVATKKFILNHKDFTDTYKNKIRQFYPSPKELAQLINLYERKQAFQHIAKEA